ncbi:MAG: hypothetical protein VKK59_05070 [Vampirovibrionales bacterium]|nr:hypothetical protein [Vampirovibrionales bacterium]
MLWLIAFGFSARAEETADTFPAGESVEAVMAKSRQDQQRSESSFRWWPFGKKKIPPSESKIVNVGPRQTGASAGSLLRMTQPLAASGRALLPGFYEVRFVSGPALSIVQGQAELIRLKLLPRDAVISESSPLTNLSSARDRAFLEISQQDPHLARVVLERVDGSAWQTEWFLTGRQALQSF